MKFFSKMKIFRWVFSFLTWQMYQLLHSKTPMVRIHRFIFAKSSRMHLKTQIYQNHHFNHVGRSIEIFSEMKMFRWDFSFLTWQVYQLLHSKTHIVRIHRFIFAKSTSMHFKTQIYQNHHFNHIRGSIEIFSEMKMFRWVFIF